MKLDRHSRENVILVVERLEVALMRMQRVRSGRLWVLHAVMTYFATTRLATRLWWMCTSVPQRTLSSTHAADHRL